MDYTEHMRLTDTTVVITGGSGGIGSHLVTLLADEGARVHSFDRHPPSDPVAGVTYKTVDVTDGKAIDAALREIGSPVDLLINNAGVMRRGTVLDSSEEDFDLLMDVNVKGSWLMLKHAFPRLRSGAVIVQNLSRHALHPPENPALYALSKIMVDRMLDLFERSHPGFDIRRLYPGPTDTAVARHGLSEEELTVKKKTLFHPLDLAIDILRLLKEDRKKLVFRPETWRHELV